MNDLDALFNLLFGWGFVIIAILLFLIFVVALRSMFTFNNAKIVSGTVVDMSDIGELSLPTIEYKKEGKTIQFKTKTPLSNLKVGQALDLQLGSSNEARIFDVNQSRKTPKVLFVIILLLLFFSLKSFSFLQTLIA
jgi:hypothetical protein